MRLEVARLHATHYITLGIREYSQLFEGEENDVANSLSRDDNRTDEELTNLFRIHCPSQIPDHFLIQPLPKEIISWLTALLLRLQEKPQLRGKHTRTKLGCGRIRSSTEAESDWKTHSFDDFTRHSIIKLLGAFTMAMREAQFSRPSHVQLVKGSITSAISHVSQTFREHGQPNPTLDDDGKTGFLLQRELRAFEKGDPAEKHKKAIPMAVISALAKQQISELDRAIVQLTALGIFFAFRSCEYLKVPQAELRQTLQIWLRNI